MWPFLILLASLVYPWSAATEMYGPEYQECSANSTVEIVNCVSVRTKNWEDRLTVEYETALARVDQAHREPLRSAQRLWLEYREANCRFYYSREGSIRQIESAECLRWMTEARVLKLQQMRQN